MRCLSAQGTRFLTRLARADELSILVTTDARISRLNGTWRARRRPTDVLSFGAAPGSGVLGDVVISLDTARRQARDRGRPLSDELARLLAHGVLHLLGHDHETDTEAERMARAEVDLLGAVGLVGDARAGRPADLEVRRVRARSRPRTARRLAVARFERTALLEASP